MSLRTAGCFSGFKCHPERPQGTKNLYAASLLTRDPSPSGSGSHTSKAITHHIPGFIECGLSYVGCFVANRPVPAVGHMGNLPFCAIAVHFCGLEIAALAPLVRNDMRGRCCFKLTLPLRTALRSEGSIRPFPVDQRSFAIRLRMTNTASRHAENLAILLVGDYHAPAGLRNDTKAEPPWYNPQNSNIRGDPDEDPTFPA